MNRIIIIILLLVAAVSAQSQINLNTPHNGNQTYNIAAPEYVKMLPGFEYKPQDQTTNYFRAYIDPYLIIPPTGGEIGGPPGSDPNLHGVFGAVVAEADVAGNGSAIVNVPITVCPGISGIIPQISLAYNSLTGESYMGKGWGVSGLSVITKVAKTMYYDNEISAVINAPLYEVFAIDGERMIWDEAKQYYRTEFEKFSKITKEYDGDQIKFRVWTKDGSIFEYGYTQDSRQTLVDKSGINTANAIAFYVNKISDIYGNSIEFTYMKSGGMCYPEQIKYGFTSSNPAGNSIVFHYIDQNLVMQYCFSGISLMPDYCKIDKLLSGVDVFSGESLFRKYDLQYITHGNFNKKYLNHIVESNGANEKYYPVSFTWQLEEDGYEVEKEFVDELNFKDENFIFDLDFRTQIISSNINDDLLPDFYTLTSASRPDEQKFIRYINNGSGYTKTDITSSLDALFGAGGYYESQAFTVGDFNSDSKDDLVFLNDGFILVYTANNTAIELTQLFPRPIGSITQAIANDFNGDGIADLMLVMQRIFIGIPPKCLIYFGSQNGLSYEPDEIIEFNDIPINASDVTVMTGDFNGDGASDIYCNYYFQSFAYQRIYWYSGGDFNDFALQPGIGMLPAREDKSQVQIGDFNGDMKSDLLWIFDESVINSNQNILLALSHGNGLFEFSINNVTYDDLLTAKNSSYIVSDFNNDGKTDFFQYNKSMPFISTLFLINQEGSEFDKVDILFPVFPTYDPEPGYFPRSTFISGDFNGDGNIDIMNMFEEFKKHDFPNGWKEDTKVSLNIGYSIKNKISFLTEVTNSLGIKTKFKYQYMTNSEVYIQNSGDAPVFPFVSFRGNMPLVREKKVANGLGGYFNYSYKYYSGLTHVKGKGFAGFQMQDFTDIASGKTSTTYFNQSFASYGILTPHYSTQTIILPNGVSQTLAITSVNNTMLNIGNGNISHFIYPSSTIAYDYVNQIWKKDLLLSPDEYGNFATVESYSGKIGTMDAEHSTIVSSVFENFTDNGKWILSRLKSATSTQTALNETPIVRNSSFTYYPNGRLESETIEPGNSKSNTKYYYYDGVGNIIHSKYTALGLLDRNNYTEYGADKRFIQKTINNLGHTSELLNYNTHGKPTLAKDANQNEVTFVYDNFGRLTKTIFPTGVQSQQVFRWVQQSDPDAPENSCYYTWEQTSGTPPKIIYFDNLARPLRVVVIGFDGKKVFTDTKYDTRGRTERVSDPYSFGEIIMWTINEYDYLERVIKTTLPGNITETYSYTPLVTQKTNSIGQTSSTEVNVMGWIISTTDANGVKVKNEYNSGGMLTKTYIADNSGNEISGTDITKEYDIFGNCIVVNDKNLGSKAFAYNAFGELISTTKAINGYETSYTYDGLGRLKTRSEPAGINTIWTYDTKPHAIGMIDKITYPDNSEEYFYDNLGRAIRKDITIERETFSFQNSYDLFGRSSTLTYPTGVVTKNVYNSQGFLSAVLQADNNKEIWKALSTNTNGQIIQEMIGGSITTNFSYQPYVDLVQNIKSSVKGTTIQDNTYLWDNIGNLNTRSNNMLQKTEQFLYDNLNRLTSYSTPGQSTILVAYDNLGNITSKSDAGIYQYDPVKPYQLLSIDGSNSAISHLTQNITYTSFDKIATITEDGNTLNLKYGFDHQRIKQTTTKANGDILTKLYIGGLVEKTIKNGVVSFENFIAGGNGLCAIITTYASNNNKQYNYILKDPLGSVQFVIADNGDIVEELNYDPWGRRRNPATYAYLDGNMGHFTDRGFTGHEHLDIFALVNMNGRVYDPIIGRFTSPDPFLQDALGTQGLNRYTYCLNNPLSMVDPSGHYATIGKLAYSYAATATTIVVGVVCPPLAPVASAAFAMSNVIINGGSFNNAIRAGEKTFVFSVVSMVGSNMIGGYFQSAIDKVAYTTYNETLGKVTEIAIQRALAHGAFQGVLSVAQGGNFVHGFISGAAGSLMGDFAGGSTAQRLCIAAVVGGTASYVTGGKFLNGAVTGAFVVLFNHLMHEGDPIDEDIRLNGRMYYSLDVARAMAIKITDQTGDETRILTLSCENNISYFLDAFYNSNSYSATWNSDESLKNGGYTILREEHFSCGFNSNSRFLIVSRQDWMNSRSSGHPITHTSLGIGSWHCLPNDPFGMPSFTPAQLFRSSTEQAKSNKQFTVNYLNRWGEKRK